MIHLDPLDGHPSPCDGDLFVSGSTTLHIVFIPAESEHGKKMHLAEDDGDYLRRARVIH
jgi:hypothetical protein